MRFIGYTLQQGQFMRRRNMFAILCCLMILFVAIFSNPGSTTAQREAPPGAPGTPTFTSVMSNSIRVNWTAASGAPTSYKVERCEGAGCSSFAQIASGVTTLYFDDSGLSPSTSYSYQIRANNAAGDGSYSGTGTQSTSAPQTSPQTFSTPGTFQFTVPAYGALTVQVWGGGGPGGVPYDPGSLQRGTPGGTSSFNGSIIANGGSGGGNQQPSVVGVGGTASGGDVNISGADGGVGLGGSTYCSGAGGNSPNGGTGGSPACPVDNPPPDGWHDTWPGGNPGNAAGGGGSGATNCIKGCGVAMSGGGAGGYASKTYAMGALTVGANVPVVVGAAGIEYQPSGMTVFGGAGAPGRVTVAWIAPGPPGTPGTPTFTNVLGTAMRVNWTADPASSSYKVERCMGVSCSNFAQIPGATGLTTLYFDDSGLSIGTSYRYRVRGNNTLGDGPYSGIGTQATVSLPGAPGTPTFTNITATTTRVNWTAGSAALSYKVERCQGASCSNFSEIASGVTTLFLNTVDLTPNTTYRYQVRSTNSAGDSVYTSIAQQATPAMTSPQTFGASGTFPVPEYGALTVQCWGGGGAGATYASSGNAGSQSSFNGTLIAGGGAAAVYNGGQGPPGAGGTASGGTTNTSGNAGASPYVCGEDWCGGNGGSAPGSGGSGGAGVAYTQTGGTGGIPGGGGGGVYYYGGGGGSGGYVSRVYTTGQLTPGTNVAVVIGNGGASSGNTHGYGAAGSGARGECRMTWTPPTPPGDPLSGGDTYTTSGDSSWVVPTVVTSITVKAWGAGGGRGGGNGANGGGGAYASSNLMVTPGETLTLTVGGGGGSGTSCVTNTGGGSAAAATVGAGGRGGHAGPGGCSAGGGAGGGGSIIRRGATILFAAGGGGGGGGAEGSGAGAGGGGGVTGANGSCSSIGGTAGGSGSSSGAIGGQSTGDASAGGGGGGGNFGGNGGGFPACDGSGGAGGGGGSNLASTLANGSGTAAGNNTDPSYQGNAGVGSSAVGISGNPGLMVITYTVTTDVNTPTVSSITHNSLRLNWTAIPSATSYKVERCSGDSCSSFTQIASGVTDTFYDNTSLTPATSYTYRIRGTNAGGDGPYSNTVTQATSLDAPGTPTFSSVTATSIQLSWTGVTGASSYKIERCVGAGCSNYTQIGAGVASLNFLDTNLTDNTTYRYRIRGTSAYGDGAYSGAAQQLTGACTVGGSGGNITGWAWSDTIGWISLNSVTPGSCTGFTYGLDVATDGMVTGYAWSAHIGWIRFGGLSSFPTGSGTTAQDAQIIAGQLRGWARACSVFVSGCSGATKSVSGTDLGGWDGWISLNGTGGGQPYAPRVSAGAFLPCANDGNRSCAWGDDVFGWIDFRYAATTYAACQSTQGNFCNPSGLGGTSWHRDASCFETPNPPNPCQWQCEAVSGLCIMPPQPTVVGGGLILSPTIVRPNGTTTVSWTVQDALDCWATGTNGQTVASSPTDSFEITIPTTYTLTCTDQLGVPYTVDEETVYVAPTWVEK